LLICLCRRVPPDLTAGSSREGNGWHTEFRGFCGCANCARDLDRASCVAADVEASDGEICVAAEYVCEVLDAVADCGDGVGVYVVEAWLGAVGSYRWGIGGAGAEFAT
jgi:hypothetical protein